MTEYIIVLTYCLVIKTYISAFTIHNFNPINITNFRPINISDLKTLIGPEAENLIEPLLQQRGLSRKSDEASEEEAPPMPSVFRDEKRNIFFDTWVVQGKENRLMVDNKGHMCAAIQPSLGVKDSLNMELWRFFSNLLQVRRDEMEIQLFKNNDMLRRVVVKARALSERECEQRLHANLHPFNLEVMEEAGALESAKLDNLYFHTERKSNLPTGQAPELSEEDINPSGKPNYIKNPGMLDRVLRDLMPNQEIIIRGRLLRRNSSNFIARPLLENYLGKKTLKVKRKILEGLYTKDKKRCKNFPAGPRLMVPERIAGLSVIDTLSEDGSRVVNRRVFAPLYQNETHDFVDELDYSEVQYRTSM